MFQVEKGRKEGKKTAEEGGATSSTKDKTQVARPTTNLVLFFRNKSTRWKTTTMSTISSSLNFLCIFISPLATSVEMTKLGYNCASAPTSTNSQVRCDIFERIISVLRLICWGKKKVEGIDKKVRANGTAAQQPFLRRVIFYCGTHSHAQKERNFIAYISSYLLLC